MKRLMIRLPDPAHAALQQRAHQAGEPLASTAAGLLRTVLEDNETATSRRARLAPVQHHHHGQPVPALRGSRPMMTPLGAQTRGA